MENIVLRYNGQSYYCNSYNKIIPESSLERPDVRSLQKDSNDAITKAAVSSYKTLIVKLKEDQKNRYSKTYYNFISGDYFIVGRTTLFSNDISLLCVYKIENDEIRKLLKLLLNNKESSVCLATVRSQYSWIASPDALDVMFTSAMLDSRKITKFEKHQKRKKNGKIRVYYAPNDEIKVPLQHLNHLLQSVYDKRNIDFQIAYKKGKSVYDNAKIHEGNKYVFNIDLKDFYPSCKRDLVRKYISFLFNGALNKSELIETFLDIILIDDGLFIGNPISGCLANTILSKPVNYLKNMCKKYDMEFSVYADDMSFSSNKFISEDFVKGMFNRAFTTYNMDSYFSLNEDKSIGYTGCNRKITGLSINDSNKVTISRRYYRTLRTMIEHLARGDNSVNVRKLQGKVAYATMVDDSGKVYYYLKKFKSTVKKYKLCSDEKMQELAACFEKQTNEGGNQ